MLFKKKYLLYNRIEELDVDEAIMEVVKLFIKDKSGF